MRCLPERRIPRGTRGSRQQHDRRFRHGPERARRQTRREVKTAEKTEYHGANNVSQSRYLRMLARQKERACRHELISKEYMISSVLSQTARIKKFPQGIPVVDKGEVSLSSCPHSAFAAIISCGIDRPPTRNLARVCFVVSRTRSSLTVFSCTKQKKRV